MSSQVTKVVFRFRLPLLDKATSADRLQYFKERLGEPDEVGEEWDDSIYFHYDLQEGTQVIRHNIRPVYSREGQWGAELVLLRWRHDSPARAGVKPEILEGRPIVLKGIVEQIVAEGFPATEVEKGSLHAYTWYNGGDEPVHFE